MYPYYDNVIGSSIPCLQPQDDGGCGLYIECFTFFYIVKLKAMPMNVSNEGVANRYGLYTFIYICYSLRVTCIMN